VGRGRVRLNEVGWGIGRAGEGGMDGKEKGRRGNGKEDITLRVQVRREWTTKRRGCGCQKPTGSSS
jgi:hypothetical protein